MPTIDQLAAVTSVSDTDELLVSQADVAHKATRAQLLAGVQPALAVPQGTLLGRVSSGLGAPETITVGANLTLANATLSAPPAFSIAAQAVGGPPGAGDLVAISQGGQIAAVTYAAFAAGFAGIAGLNATGFAAAPTGGVGSRRLGDLLSDAITVESFGAAGDGTTDDTAAFAAAIGSGRALRLDGRVYAIAGCLNFDLPTAVIGVAGQTVLRRTAASPAGAWITASGSTLLVDGVVFDGGSLAATDTAVVSVTNTCTTVSMQDCQFLHATGPTTGHGVLIDGAAGTGVTIVGCRFAGNSLDGLHVANSAAIDVADCAAVGNGGSGITVAAGIDCRVSGNFCSDNTVGIAVGSWQTATGSTPAGLHDIRNNLCIGNSCWGLAVGGTGPNIVGNTLSGNGSLETGGGLTCRVAGAQITGNHVIGGAQGLDLCTSYDSVVGHNYVSGAGTGVIAAGCQNVVVTDNFLLRNGWAVSVPAFCQALSAARTGPITIDRNWIGFTTAQGGGIQLLDGVQGAAISDNDLNGWGSATGAQALWLHTDAAIVRGNRWNNAAQVSVQPATVAGLSALVVPDAADAVLVTGAPPAVNSVLTAHQVDTLGQITFIRLLQPGSGYTQAQVTISGNGAGASVQAVCSNGQVVGFIVANPGSGYGSIGASADVTITGDGSGATAQAFVGLPVLAGRQLRLTCLAPVRLRLAGSSPLQQSWSQYDLSVPAFGAVDLVGAFGGWYGVQSPPVDYVAPTGNGGAVFQSVGGGDVFLRPSAGGSLRLSSAVEPAGCTCSVGRGSPNGMVTAPPGSDFRNLNGGGGNTFWIKCSGTDDQGWIAVA
jgi:hypothetical protein